MYMYSWIRPIGDGVYSPVFNKQLSLSAHYYVCTLPIDEGVYVNAAGGQLKDSRLQWGEVPSSIGKD